MDAVTAGRRPPQEIPDQAEEKASGEAESEPAVIDPNVLSRAEMSATKLAEAGIEGFDATLEFEQFVTVLSLLSTRANTTVLARQLVEAIIMADREGIELHDDIVEILKDASRFVTVLQGSFGWSDKRAATFLTTVSKVKEEHGVKDVVDVQSSDEAAA
jgi:hypothetical protein